MIFLLNSFSVKMLPPEVFSDLKPAIGEESWTDFPEVSILFKKLPERWVRALVREESASTHGVIISAIGHEATAKVLSERLGVEIPAERRDVHLRRAKLDTFPATFIVCQVELPRLAEGQVLTEQEVKAAPITFYEVLVLD